MDMRNIFFDPVTRQKLNTIQGDNKAVSLTNSQGKLIQYQKQRDLAFNLLVKSYMLNAPIDLNVLLSYSLSPVPHCLGTLVTRQKLNTIEDDNKTVSLTTSQGKLIQYQKQRDLAFNLLVKSYMLNAPIDLNVLLSYSLSPVPHCLGTLDGYFYQDI